MDKMNGRITISLLVVLTSIALAGLGGQASAQESPAPGGDSGSSKLIGAGMAFGLAALGAGIGLGFVGAAGLAQLATIPRCSQECSSS